MAKSELKHLSRRDLLEILVEQSRRIDELTSELEATRSQLENHIITCERTGSLAEAALALNGVFEAAQAAALKAELERTSRRARTMRVLRGTLLVLVAVAAVAVLAAMLFLPVLMVHGTSMTPTLHDGEVVVSVKGAAYDRRDVIAFYYNNSILVKRVIATEGQWVDIADDGTVTVDGERLDKPYVDEPALGARGVSTLFARNSYFT